MDATAGFDDEAHEVHEAISLLFGSLEAASSAVLIVRPSAEGSRIVYVNGAFCSMSGYSREELVGARYSVLLGPGTSRQTLRDIREAVDDERPVTAQLVNYRKDGGRFQVELDIFPLRENEGRVAYWASIQRDVTGSFEGERGVRDSSDERHILRTLIDSARDMIFAKDTGHRFLLNNRAHIEALGAGSQKETLGKTDLDYYPPEITDKFHADDERLFESGESIIGTEEPILLRSGERRWVQTTKVPLRDAAGRVEGLVGISRDMTEEILAREQLRESESLLKAVTDGAPVILFSLDADGVFNVMTGRGMEALGIEPRQALGHLAEEVLFDYPGILRDVRRSLAGEEVSATAEIGGTIFDTRYSPVRASGGGVGGVIGVATDITKSRRLQRELEYRAFHDPLTGLPNRDLLLDRLTQSLFRSYRRSGRGDSSNVGLLFMDLDNFKLVNDSLGHDAGDSLLTEVSDRLGGCVRPQDTVARLGGDEFAVVLEDVSREEAVSVSGRVIEAFRASFVFGKSDYEANVSFSIGIALEGHPGPDAMACAEELLQRADIAMYQAKASGRSSYTLYDPVTGHHVGERLKLENALRREIEGRGPGGLRVYYQPIVSLATNEVAGVEALLRWEHPERGLLSPGDFLYIAEETGLIVPLGRWVLRESCRWLRELNDSRSSPLRVSVNLSPRQLAHESLTQDVRESLASGGLAPELLELEITENSAMEDVERAIAVLGELRSWGVSVSMDDFGTGYSSLGYLKRLPVDTLKIDRSIIAGIGSDTRDSAVTSAVLALAKSLGQRVVAEGIEEEAQVEQLRGLGCGFGQGCYFFSPKPPGALAPYLARGPDDGPDSP